MEERASFLTFWGIFFIVGVTHIAILGISIEQSSHLLEKAPKKIRISLGGQGNSGSKKPKMMKSASVKPMVSAAKKKTPRPKKKVVKDKPLKKAQLLAAPPKKIETFEPEVEVIDETLTSSSDLTDMETTNAYGSGYGSGDGSSEATEAENDYIGYIRERLLSVMHYPRMARKRQWQGVVEVTFIIMSDGRVKKVYISSPCPYKLLNETTKQSISEIKRFNPLPKEMGRESLEVTVPFNYRLQ